MDGFDLEVDLRRMLASAKLRLAGYEDVVEDLEKEELEHDLKEYREILEREVAPLVRRALLARDEKLLLLARQVEEVYERILELIKEKLADERSGR